MEKLINVVTFSLPLGIFLYFNLIGFAALSLLRPKQSSLQNLLMSPAAGLACTLVPVFWLNQLGLPVSAFALPLTLFLAFLSLFILLRLKPNFSVKEYWPFFAIFLFALFITGKPLLTFGFNWVSYANADMVNYVLGAFRFLHHGYFDLPDPNKMIQGKDYSQYFWFYAVPGMIRGGSELMLAWLSQLARLNPVEIFMPLILSFHLTLISAAGALMLTNKKPSYAIALTTCLLLTVSALTTLGTLYQLIAQVAGLSLFIMLAILLFQLFQSENNIYYFRQGFLISLMGSALLILYPEISLILGMVFFAFILLNAVKGWKPNKAFFYCLGFTLLLSIIALNQYWIAVFAFLKIQASAGITHQKGNLFPYFLLPSGLANLWGLQTLSIIPSEPWSSFTILLGFILSVSLVYFIIKQIKNLYPVTVIAAVIFLLALYLAVTLGQESGFSLYKLAMYAQPFIFGVLTIALFSLSQRIVRIGLVLAVISLSLYTQHNYVLDSFGHVGDSFSELPNASFTQYYSELKNISQTLPKDSNIISDSASLVGSQLQSTFLSDTNLRFYSQPFFSSMVFTGQDLFKQIYLKEYALAKDYKSTLNHADVLLHFSPQLTFHKMYFEEHPEDFMLMDSPLRNIFNRYSLATYANQNYIVKPITEVNNHLIFINSNLGQYYYLGQNDYISLNNLEKDYFYPENTMAGIGRYFLFQVINPSKKFRLVLNMTDGLNNDGINALPHPQVIGDRSYTVPTSGRGSARVFSQPITPKIIKNDPYILLDMQENGKMFPSHFKGLMKLYGNNVALDNRLLVGFARDISLISEEDYQRLQPPSFLSQFPKDLNNANLEYSGIYEDGWLSEEAYLKLLQPTMDSKLIITGVLPNFQNQIQETHLTLYVDNKKLLEKTIIPGDFQIAADVPYSPTRKIIRLHFDKYFSLPKGDERPVTVKLNLIGFKTIVTPTFVSQFPNDLKNPSLEHNGIFDDGWAAQDVSLKLAQPANTKLVVDGMLPAIDKQRQPTVLTIYVNKKVVAQEKILPGNFHLAFPVPIDDKKKIVHLHFSREFPLSKEDNRVVAIKLNQIGFKNS